MKHRITSVALLVILISTTTLAQTANNDPTNSVDQNSVNSVISEEQFISFDSKLHENNRDGSMISDDVYRNVDFEDNLIIFDGKIHENNDTESSDDVARTDEFEEQLQPFDSKLYENNRAVEHRVHDGDTEDAELREDALSVYPNPSDGLFNLEINITDVSTLLIFDMAGNVVYDQAINGLSGPNTLQVDLTDLGAGFYFIQLTQNGDSITHKIVVS